MGLFSKRRQVDPADVDALRQSLAEMQQAIQASKAEQAGLLHYLDELRDRPQPPSEDHEVRRRVDALTTSLTAVDTLRDQIEVLQDQLAGRTDELNNRTAELAERIDQIPDRSESANDLHRRLEAVEQRLTSVGTELTNQIDELSGDIDALANLPSNKATPPAASDGATTEQIAQLRDSQTRLAAEQARYQISFREDLAKLAEQIRSNTPRR